ncbi:hypothetical protein AVEN_223649-1 [Araneus ventricosus]|uniref:Uncharacterized protein n=1 Tax=Araneus ventricosus TaxID=182803 RepID=A0A4Y2JSF1_ARAVE|nr:hypothetical protein AVEN_223649-1 [Araneus ventricosus]
MTRTTPELAPPSWRHTNGRTFGHYVRFTVQQAPYTVDLQWNRVSSLGPSGPEVEIEALPLGNRGPVLERIARSLAFEDSRLGKRVGYIMNASRIRAIKEDRYPLILPIIVTYFRMRALIV